MSNKGLHLIPFTKKLGIVILGVAIFSSLAFAWDGNHKSTGASGTTGTSDSHHGSGGTGGGGGGTEPPVALSLKILSETVPSGGVYQLQLDLTEPRPLSKGGSRFTVASNIIGTGVGASINSPSGRASGVVLSTAAGLQVAFTSQDSIFGTNAGPGLPGGYPILTLALPIKADAAVGTQVPVSADLGNTAFLDASGQPLTFEIKPGTLTIGGTLNITNVLPGGGTVPAGAMICILGLGFTTSSVVQVDGANVVTSRLISSNELDVTLDTTLVLDAVRVQVTNNTEIATYYSYLRAAWVGQSNQQLLTATDPMFSRVTYSNASLPWTNGGTLFTGLALQNPDASPTTVNLQLVSSANIVLQNINIALPGRSKMIRDLVEFFGQPPQGASTIVIHSSQPIQLLGVQGDTAAATVGPIIVTAL